MQRKNSLNAVSSPGSVSRLVITSRHVLADGRLFGDVGSYEQLDGIAFFLADPLHPENSLITDLNLAPRDGAGRVHYAADFRILRPLDTKRGNHRLLLDILNRGTTRALNYFNSAPDSPPGSKPGLGNGFLMEQGYTLAWCGWQHDVPDTPGLLRLHAPHAVTSAGPLCGRMTVTFQPNLSVAVQFLADRMHRPYPVCDLNDPNAVLTEQDHEDAPEHIIPRDDWQFARLENGRIVPDATHVHLSTGFQAGKVYQVTYTATGGQVAGCGLLATRDFTAFLKFGETAHGNPCAGGIKFAYAFGASQSGRFLRQFLYLGLNQDAHDRMVFDGCLAHVAGARHGDFNARFAQPSTQASRTPCNQFPFSDVEQTDAETERTEGLLSRLAASGKIPKVMHAYTSSEYWAGHGALVHIDINGRRDLEVPELVRIYHFGGTQHPMPSFPLKAVDQSQGYRGQFSFNCIDWRPLLRAALVNLDDWVARGVSAPPSQHPRLDDGTAVRPETLATLFRAIPGVKLPEPQRYFRRLDFGNVDGVATNAPPRVGSPYACLVPAVDSDGNDACGVRMPTQSVPLGTLTGWNLRHADIGGEGQLLASGGASGGSVLGSTIPFPATGEARVATNDPRRAINERYASKDDYIARIKQAALHMVGQRYLLEQDINEVIGMASKLYDVMCRQQ